MPGSRPVQLDHHTTQGRRNSGLVPMPRRSSNQAPEDSDYLPPTDAEWNRMLKYGAFRVSDYVKKEYKFSLGDTVTILPHEKEPGSDIGQSEYWVAEILEIRGITYEEPEPSTDVWANVRWWYSAKDVSGVIKSFDPTKCSPYERMHSSHTDRVSSQAFNEVIKMKWLRDDDLEQTYISPSQFYSRYELNRKGKRLDPKPGGSSCTCGVPYAYHDSETVMHFCPRPLCRKWYHQTCLLNAGSLFDVPSPKVQKSPGKSKRGRPSMQAAPTRVLTSPDTAATLVLPPARTVRPEKRRRTSMRSSASMSPQKGKVTVTLEDPLEGPEQEDGGLIDALGRLPGKLVLLASQPIVRGSLFVTGGVSGNVRPVVRARRLVHEILGLGGDEADNMSVEYDDDSTKVERGEVPDDWEERVMGLEPEVKLDECVVKIEGKKDIPVFACPECGSAI